ncbi:hypothetical protein [Streptomyces turgidiscabies]|uniref:hypothetical protein n=1 Tax=Streptomyces turgidiscabies TaxID=85558 RepID=UPI0038F79053
MVTTTINGEARQTPEKYFEYLPVPPRDFDGALMIGVCTVAVAVTALSIAWSTASIGDLLGTVVVSVIAYGAAAVFDSAWIACMAIEWIERHDQQRAQYARVAGWIALGAAVAAIVVHGYVRDDRAAGYVGGCVSIIAKGLWLVVMGHYRVKLGEGARSWLSQRRQEIATERAVSVEVRRLDAARAYHAAVFGSTAAVAQQIAAAPAVPELPHDALPPPHTAAVPPHTEAPLGVPPVAPPPHPADEEPQRPREERRTVLDIIDETVDAALAVSGLSKADAVRRVRDALPALNAVQIAEHLTRRGWETSDGYVRTVNSRDREAKNAAPKAKPKPEASGPYL